VILELNASSFMKDKIGKRGDIKKSIQLAKLAKKYNVFLSLNSDAHFHTRIGDISSLEYIIKKAKITENDIINNSSEKVMNFLNLDLNNKFNII
jgi:putative hydrolase